MNMRDEVEDEEEWISSVECLEGRKKKETLLVMTNSTKYTYNMSI